jgi:formate hydrogenlyase subunit 3/multisubunit Na+/H+ antiporter MnhD subunit
MSAPLVLFIAVGALSLVVLILRSRPGLSAIIAATGTTLVAVFVLRVTFDEPFVFFGLPVKLVSTWRVLGRALTLGEGNRAAVGFIFLTGAYVFAGAWITRPSTSFFFVGLSSLAVVVASMLIQPFLFAALFLELAAMGAVLLLVSREYPARRGGLRLLILYTIAMLAILMAGWTLEHIGGSSIAPNLAIRATLLLALGFSVLMAVPPFHLWLPSAAGRANPYAIAFVTVILQSAGLFFLLRFLDTYVWLRQDLRLFAGIRVAGIAMVLFGCLLALAQRSFSKAMAYALLTDFGVMLLAVGANTATGYRLALGLTGVRVVSLVVWALGLARVVDQPSDDMVESLRGAAYKSPLSAAAALVGVLSIAGFPLTAGFPGRWALISHLASIDFFAGAAIVVASLFIGATAVHWGNVLLSVPLQELPQPEPASVRIILIGGIAMCILLGVFPQLLYPWVVQAVAGMTQLLP